jgi:hypothetical protein
MNPAAFKSYGNARVIRIAPQFADSAQLIQTMVILNHQAVDLSKRLCARVVPHRSLRPQRVMVEAVSESLKHA